MQAHHRSFRPLTTVCIGAAMWMIMPCRADVLLPLLDRSGFEPGSKNLVVTASVVNVNACGTGAVSGASVPGIDASLAVKAGVLIHLASSTSTSAGYRTNVVFFNSGGEAAEVEVRVRRGDGGLLSATTFTLHGPNGFLQRPLDDPETFPGVAGTTDTNLWLEFRSSQPLLAFASVIDNVSGDPFTIVAVNDGAGLDTTAPFPIDRTGLPGEPLTYKSLELGLTET